MQTLRKIISRYMQMVAFFLISIVLVLIIGIQIANEQRRARESATRTFAQMEQVFEENQRERIEVEAEYHQTCLHNAEAIAYIIQDNPSVLDSVEEMKKIAEFIEVDEIHIFDETGCIFAGTHPEYYGYTFDSGEQMNFFKPMLEDKSLKLVQDIMPNTAEAKMMQYSALWSSNGEFIVEVGMEPVSVIEVTEKNELSHLFSLFRVNVDANYYAIDEVSREIVGSTDLDSVGKNITEIGLDFNEVKSNDNGFHARVNGESSYCVFTKIDTNYVGRVVSTREIYQRVPSTALIISFCLTVIAMILVRAVTWYMNRYVVDGIHDMNEKLRMIARGNLEETVDIRSSVEFSELSSYINEMVKSLLYNNKKMSYVLGKTNMYVGVYEYNEYMKKVRFTEYIPKILLLDADKMEYLASDYKIFEEFIGKIHKNPVPGESGVFKLNEESERYVRIEEIFDDNGIFGIVMDVTEEIIKLKKIRVERDIDSLTGLYNRRGLELRLSMLFKEPEKLGHSAIVMMDADGLKKVNDTYGHEKGDVYIEKISGVIKNFGSKSSVAARQGGDEFVLFLYHYDNEEELVNTIKGLEEVQNNSTAQLDEDVSVPLSFSFGYSLTNGSTDFKKLIKEADAKMYKNKRERKKKA